MSNTNIKRIEDTIKVVPNFPKEGISFKDITPIFGNPLVLGLTIDELANKVKDQKFDYILGLESRGFLLGVPLALKLNIPFIPVRKKGKLPRATVSTSYALEYGSAEIEVHKEDIKPGSRVLVVDDIVATGGTLLATKELMMKLGATCEDALVLGYLEEIPGIIEKLKDNGIKLHYLFTF